MNETVGRDEIAPRLREEIDTPALLIDAATLEANIAAMAALCAPHSVRLRPHAKSHKSPIVAAMQEAAGAVGICCAKLGEAEVMAGGGIGDILITTPVTDAAKLRRLVDLARRTGIAVVADDAEGIDRLGEAAHAAQVTIEVVVEVDVGQGRCGVGTGTDAVTMAEHIARHRSLRFGGLQGYQGLLQGLVSYGERRHGVQRALEKLLDAADQVRRAGYDAGALTGGGTGSAAVDLDLGGLTELQPGSYVFMDASYLEIEWDAAKSRPPFRPSLSILAGVVSKPATDRVVLDVGWKAASADAGPPTVKNSEELVFRFAGDEHGIVRRRDGGSLDLRPGDKIELIPSHCDTTVNLYDSYTVLRGDRVEALWPVAARGCSS